MIDVHFVLPIHTTLGFPRKRFLLHFMFCTYISMNKLWTDKTNILLRISWKNKTHKLKRSVSVSDKVSQITRVHASIRGRLHLAWPVTRFYLLKIQHLARYEFSTTAPLTIERNNRWSWERRWWTWNKGSYSESYRNYPHVSLGIGDIMNQAFRENNLSDVSRRQSQLIYKRFFNNKERI